MWLEKKGRVLICGFESISSLTLINGVAMLVRVARTVREKSPPTKLRADKINLSTLDFPTEICKIDSRETKGSNQTRVDDDRHKHDFAKRKEMIIKSVFFLFQVSFLEFAIDNSSSWT